MTTEQSLFIFNLIITMTSVGALLILIVTIQYLYDGYKIKRFNERMNFIRSRRMRNDNE